MAKQANGLHFVKKYRNGLSRRGALIGMSGASVSLATGLAFGNDAAEGSAHSVIAEIAQRLAGQQKISLSVLVPDGCQPNLQPIIAAFTQLSGIEVILRATPVDDINTALMLSDFEPNSSVDLALVASFGLPDLADAGVIQATDTFEQKHPIARSVRNLSLYKHADQIGGKTFGPQFDGDLYLMFYNRALLNDASLSASYQKRYMEPFDVAKSWPQLDRMMQHVHESRTDRHGGVLFRTPGYINWEFWARLHATGTLPFDDQMQPLINSTEGIATIESLIAASEWQRPGAASLGLVENWQAFAEGTSLCHIGWGGSQKYFRRHPQSLPDGIVASQLPGIDRNGQLTAVPFFNWGWNFAIPRTSRHAELSFLFAAFAVTPAMSSAAVAESEGFIDPFQPAHYHDSRITAVYGETFLATHEQGMRNAIPDFYVRGHRDYMEALSTALLLANRGQISAVEAADNISKRWQALTDGLGRTGQIRQWRALKNNYPPSFLEQLNK